MVNELRLVARTRLTHVHAHVFSSLIPLSYLSSLYSFCSTIWEFKIECIYDLCSDSCFHSAISWVTRCPQICRAKDIINS